ncbi:Plasma membrane sulfite pump involved in sulfite metabolism [Stygiomarasmius scandens]|uniref:Plasma membrane sulfite pump involved in sulfite metabolism n=1 Tax=Marasmiellus scandens TaxID=2682957 RepID=A0ABR1K763_9AGAR
MTSDASAKALTIKDVVRNFAPAWFAVTMGTGSISILFHVFPYGHSEGMQITSLAIMFLNLVLFLLFSVITIARYCLFPNVWRFMIHHPVQSLYIGTFPMGATTILNIAVGVIHEHYGFGGKPFLYFIWACWWANVAISLLCCFGMLHFMKTSQNHSLQSMTAVWLLPVVTLVVASSTGGVVASSLYDYNNSHAMITVVISLLMVTVGLTLSFMLLTIYLLRLIVSGLPPGATVLSVFLPLGPMGQAGYSFLLIGQFFQKALPLHGSTSKILTADTTGDTINVICVFVAFVLWSLASMWIIFALLAVQDVLRQSTFSFRVPFWGLIFPNGVYANLTINLAGTFDSSFFRILGSTYAVATLVLWTFVAIRTVILAHRRTIFEAPCLEDVDLRQFNQDRSTSRSKERKSMMTTTSGFTSNNL